MIPPQFAPVAKEYAGTAHDLNAFYAGIGTKDFYLSLLCPEQACEQLEGCGFPGAVGPGVSGKLTAAQHKAYVIQCINPAVFPLPQGNRTALVKVFGYLRQTDDSFVFPPF